MPKNNEFFKKIDAKLNALISLKLRSPPETVREKVKLLLDAGISNKNISNILDISEKYVGKEKSLIKKSKR